MDKPQPDFGIVERTWESRLREHGLSPSRVGTGISTGYERFELYRQETQVAEFELDHEPHHGFVGSIEVKAVLELTSLGAVTILDLITRRGPSLDGALEACANTFMDVTFPPLETLFSGKRPGTGTITLSSYTIGLNRALKWDGLLGSLQIQNDPGGEVRERLKKHPPITLMLDALTGHLSEIRLHWCKLYGSNTPAGGLIFGCSIDGQKSAPAEAEMAAKFGEPPPGHWEFCQFIVVRPAGEADPATAAALRDRAAEAFPQRKRSWWSRLFDG